MDKYSVILKTLCLVCIFISTVYSLVDIEIDDLTKEDKIQIEVKGNIEKDKVITVDRGTVLGDVIDEININNDADLSAISLVKPLKDKEVIIIPKTKESNLVSINGADVDELCTLPGIGINIAKRIIDYRESKGSFLSLEELINVKGIGDKKFEKIRELICL